MASIHLDGGDASFVYGVAGRAVDAVELVLSDGSRTRLPIAHEPTMPVGVFVTRLDASAIALNPISH
jgi:hypothetical protein